MTIECFVLLLIMMNSQQGLTGRDRDIDDFIKQEKDLPKFRDMFKKILEGGSSTKKVDNFLRENQEGMDFKQEIPGYIDPRTGKVTREDQIAGFPFPYNPAGLPDDVFEATQRQYGKTDVFGPYTADDARLIRQFFGNRKGLG
jgi:hypothetical protein